MRLAVIDANIALSWVLSDEPSSKAILRLLDDFIAEKVRLIAPSLWEYEVHNVLRVSIARDRINEQQAQRASQSLLKLRIELYEFRPLLIDAWNLALAYNLSIYDASYLALANQQRCEFYSSDRQLIKAAQKSGLIHLPEEF